MFHPRCGNCVTLSNGNRTASRTNPNQEFNKGLVFSLEPIKDNELFEVKIDKKLNTWSGSIEIGVTVCNPDIIDIPITATDLKGGTWIMLGQGVFRDGLSLHEAYGCDLDKLVEEDKVGVMKTSQGELKFFVNGECQGVAAANLPSILYAVVDMYGKCAQISVTTATTPDSNPIDVDLMEEANVRDSNLGFEPASSSINNNNFMSEPPIRDINQSTECLRVPPITSAGRPPLAPTASEEASLTEATCSGSALTNQLTEATCSGSALTNQLTEATCSGSALTNHIANISIANSLLSGNDSNLLEDERDGRESSLDGSESLGGEIIDARPPPINNNNNNNDANNRCSNFHHRRDEAQRRQNDAENIAASERLRFHHKAGSLVKLSSSGRTAERKRPMDEFNNGVVMSNRALKLNELFEIRIDRLVDKWSGSIEVGITTHNPGLLEFPATMTSMRSGTIMMSGTAILTNGKGTLREYGNFNLDELKEGDKIGMMIKEQRNLHYFINSVEQGVAAYHVPAPVWAVVDLYGMTVKVTICDRDERNEQNIATRNSVSQNAEEYLPMDAVVVPNTFENNNDNLLFHSYCGTYAEVMNGGRTAHRPNAMDDFNNGVVLSNRPLKPNELFEVQLDKLVDKWAGSLEIGVTTHTPTEFDFPSTMTNVRTGTWLMTSNGVTHNGTTIIEAYGLNIDRLRVGGRIGVCRKENGDLHFYVDSVDQGVASTNVPERIFGVVDLYGQAAQATICSSSDRLALPHIETGGATASSTSSSTIYCDLRFHHLHGRNARIVKGGLVAQRSNANGEFNDAIVMSNRPLHDGEMFEVMIEKMVDRWSGSLEAGVTAIAPEQIDFPSTMTDIDYETWMLSGSSVMRNGVTTMNNYPCDLDTLCIGTRIGMMRHSDGTLHYYVNGDDQGVACSSLKTGLWAVIDLYGQCAQVSIVHNPVRLDQSLLSVSQYLDISRLSLPIGGQHSLGTEVLHRWSKCCGANIILDKNQTVATRVRHFNHGLVFSSQPLEPEELFEVKLEKVFSSFSGSIRIGLSSLPINEFYPSGALPSSLSHFDSCDTWWVDGCQVRRNGFTVLKPNYCPNLSRLQAGDKIGVKRSAEGIMKIFINGEDFGSAASNVSKPRMIAVVELFGSVESVSIISTSKGMTPVLESDQIAMAPIAVSQDSLELCVSDAKAVKEITDKKPVPQTPLASEEENATPSVSLPATTTSVVETSSEIPSSLASRYVSPTQFHENRGRNIQLSFEKTVAVRLEGYDRGIVFSSNPLNRNFLFQIHIGALLTTWSSSLIIGVTCQKPEKLILPSSAFDLRKNTWLICGDSVFNNGLKIKGRYGPNLDSLSGGHLIGVLVDEESRLHLYINGVDQGVAAKEIPPKPYCIIDLYGQCQEVVISNSISHRGESVDHNAKNLKNQQAAASMSNSHNINHHINLQQKQILQQQSSGAVATVVASTTSATNSTLGRSQDVVSREEIVNNDNVNGRSRSTQYIGERVISPVTVKDKHKDDSQCCPENSVVKNCEYQNLCNRFLSSLSLPDSYFSSEGNMCFCETCYKIRGDEPFHTKGNPPKQYALPVGWCRISLVTAVGTNNESWHMAYHGTKVGAIRRMLDKGELLFSGELGIGARLANRKNKDDASDGSVLFFSPSVAYASTNYFAPSTSFFDTETEGLTEVKTVLQVAVEPDSYKVGAPSYPFTASPGDSPSENSSSSPPRWQNDSIEWVTKERGATQLLALLVKILRVT